MEEREEGEGEGEEERVGGCGAPAEEEVSNEEEEDTEHDVGASEREEGTIDKLNGKLSFQNLHKEGVQHSKEVQPWRCRYFVVPSVVRVAVSLSLGNVEDLVLCLTKKTSFLFARKCFSKNFFSHHVRFPHFLIHLEEESSIEQCEEGYQSNHLFHFQFFLFPFFFFHFGRGDDSRKK